jgi:hypothetical protein
MMAVHSIGIPGWSPDSGTRRTRRPCGLQKGLAHCQDAGRGKTARSSNLFGHLFCAILGTGRKRGGLSGADAIAAAEWATSALMQSLRKTTSLVTHASFVKLKPKQLNDSPHIEEVNSQVFRFLDSVFLSSAGSGMSFREISCSVYSTQFLSKYLALSSGCTQDLQSEWRFHVDVQRRH